MTETRTDQDPIYLLRGEGRRLLVPATLESTLLQTPRPFLHGQWSVSARERGLFVDLSRVEWVELEAVVQLCLLVESARREGVAVSLALPVAKLRVGEASYASRGENLAERERILRRVRRRRELRTFLRYLSFEEALSPPHLGSDAASLRLLEDYDRTVARMGPDDERVDEVDDPEPPDDASIRTMPRFAFPLMWVTHSSGSDSRRLADYLANIVANEKRGVGRLDAASIANVVLYELVDNAIRHAQVENALVAAFAWPASLRPRSEEYLDAVQPYIRWLSSTRSSGVEVVVGDSGRGVVDALGDAYDEAAKRGAPTLPEGRTASVLAWAFDRYSTSDREKIERPDTRTRGLYRVERLVKKHAGLVTLRSSDRLIALDHGGPGYARRAMNEKTLAEAPGTLLRVHMLPLRGTVTPRSGRRNISDLNFVFCEVEVDSDGALQAASRASIREALGDGRVSVDRCAIISVTNDDLEKLAIERLLREISELRDPGAAVVLLGCPWALVDNACDSLVSDVDRSLAVEGEQSNAAEALDPVLVIGSGGTKESMIWTGASRATTDVLEALTSSEDHFLDGAEIGTIVADQATRSDVLGTLLMDAAIVTADGDGLRARLHPEDVFDAVARRFSAKVTDAVVATGSAAVVRTRSLVLVKRWLSADRLFPGEGEEFAALRTLASRSRANAAWLSVPNLMVADANSVRSRMRRLRELLDIDREVIVPGEDGGGGPARRPMIGPEARVIVYADIIASGESVRRCLTQVLRDRAEPALIVTLVDGRLDRGTPIEFWGWQLPVVALADVELATDVARGEISNVDSNGNEDLDELDHADYQIAPDELLDLVARRSGLHFGHTGAPGDRHFTFYLDAERLLDGPELTEALCEAVHQWRGEGGGAGGQGLEIWHPSPEPKASEPAATLARRLREVFGEVDRVWAVGRRPGPDGWTLTGRTEPVDGRDVVMVDWGAIGGGTVTQMVRLAAEAGAGRVLACVCLSQLAPSTEWYQGSVRLLRARQPVAPSASGQGSLDELGKQAMREVPVRTIFLSSLPVAAYPPHECPVCWALDELPDDEHASPLLRAYVERQRNERLRAHSRAETVAGPTVDVDQRPLSGEAAVALLRFRRDLAAARWSTGGRQRLAERVGALSKRLDQGADAEATSEVCEMLRLLAVETQWLRRAPLVLERVRRTLARLAASVALADDGVEEADRSNAIIVLRAASKRTFAEHLEAIYVKIEENDRLVGQLVHSTLTYIDRPYLQNESAWMPLVHALTGIVKLIDSGQALQAAPGARDMRMLADRATARMRRATTRKMTLLEAWNALASALGAEYQRHGAATAVRRIYPHRYEWWLDPKADESREARDAYETYTLPQSWDRIESFLTTEVVPLLIALLPVLRTGAAQDALGRQLVTKLLEDLESRTWVSQWEFAQIVRSIVERRTSLDEAQVRERFRLELDVLFDGVLRPGVDEASIPPSNLVRFLAAAPAPLGEILPKIVTSFSEPLVEPVSMPEQWDHALWVFFPRPSLSSLLQEIFENVSRHHESTSGGSSAPARISVRYEIDGRDVILTVVNTRTKPSRENGVFLRRYERELKGFGGSLRHGPVERASDPELTYQTTITFLSGA